MLWASLNEGLIIASALSMAFGWRWIRRGQVDRHRRLMLTAVALGAAFFVSYLSHSLIVGDTSFGGPAELKPFYLSFLQVHIALATLAAALGVVTLRRALRGRFQAHRRIAPWTAVSWFIAAGTGLVVYLLLYIVYPPGATIDILRLMTGR